MRTGDTTAEAGPAETPPEDDSGACARVTHTRKSCAATLSGSGEATVECGADAAPSTIAGGTAAAMGLAVEAAGVETTDTASGVAGTEA